MKIFGGYVHVWMIQLCPIAHQEFNVKRRSTIQAISPTMFLKREVYNFIFSIKLWILVIIFNLYGHRELTSVSPCMFFFFHWFVVLKSDLLLFVFYDRFYYFIFWTSWKMMQMFSFGLRKIPSFILFLKILFEDIVKNKFILHVI